MVERFTRGSSAFCWVFAGALACGSGAEGAVKKPPEVAPAKQPVKTVEAPATVEPAKVEVPARVVEAPPVAASGPLRAQAAGAYRPCELAVESCTQDGKPCGEQATCVTSLINVIPEGEPLELGLGKPETLRWKYAADERLLASPGFVYRHTGANTGVRARSDGSGEVAVTFDDAGRLREVGDGRREYTPDGRAAGFSTRGKGGKWKQTVTYKWTEKQAYAVNWTYPDADEFCEPEPSAVDLDEQGRVVRMVYEDCQINYSEYTLNYHYDAHGRVDAIDVDCNQGRWHLALKYECPA